VSISHAMRNAALKGVCDVGLRVERNEK
jgi:hypothetical protein